MPTASKCRSKTAGSSAASTAAPSRSTAPSSSTAIHEAAQALWHFFWHEFCDWYLELKKLRFEENSGLNAHWRNMLTVFETALRLLHPVMPFLTEELWQRLASDRDDRPESIALAPYPQYNPEAVGP